MVVECGYFEQEGSDNFLDFLTLDLLMNFTQSLNSQLRIENRRLLSQNDRLCGGFHYDNGVNTKN